MSTIGHAAFSVAKARGAEIHVLTESETETRYLMNAFGIPKERVHRATENDSTDDVNRAAEPRCIDVVVNWSRDNVVMRSACRYVAQYGKLVELRGDEVGVLDKHGLQWLSGNRSYCSVDLAQFAKDLPTEVHQ